MTSEGQNWLKCLCSKQLFPLYTPPLFYPIIQNWGFLPDIRETLLVLFPHKRPAHFHCPPDFVVSLTILRITVISLKTCRTGRNRGTVIEINVKSCSLLHTTPLWIQLVNMEEGTLDRKAFALAQPLCEYHRRRHHPVLSGHEVEVASSKVKLVERLGRLLPPDHCHPSDSARSVPRTPPTWCMELSAHESRGARQRIGQRTGQMLGCTN